MISFACMKIEWDDLIRCSFELNKTACKVLMFMVRDGKEHSISKIAKMLRLERSSVQKAIKTLVERKLILRRQMNLDKGGYKFFYIVKDIEKIKEEMVIIIDNWQQNVKEKIKTWG